MLLEKRKYHSFEAETETRAVSNAAFSRSDIETPPEMVQVVVERGNRRWILFGRNGYEDFELQPLLALRGCQQPPAAAKERVRGGDHGGVEA